MKYIITEDRLDKLFNTYMESMYGDMSYNLNTREFILPNREIFGYLLKDHFYYGDYATEYRLNQMFGERTNELVLHYMRDHFPGNPIFGIE